ncbi:hypothetical protein AG1IA_01283 [Rhizoctonia solani AG-1 IA]|uniref:Uncharacterized protein n=1 Tax=Thanatephorus cucumeris (strain AG1-IA) TaxID=983506 RepID=L8X7Q8_THACA|nr:hypothetical protein AG1IA_01283 [Rhizoctonia solani AG-1 IA]
MSEIPSDWPAGVPFYRWPPFPAKPEGVTIIPFSQFVATGIKVDQDDDTPGVDQQGIPTIGLQARHDGEKKKRRKKRKNDKGETVEVPLAWWEELEEDTKNDFNEKRHFPVHVQAVVHAVSYFDYTSALDIYSKLIKQLGICLGLIDPNPNGVKTNKEKASSQDGESDDDFEDEEKAETSGTPSAPVTQDLYDADLKPETAREKAMDAFFQDPERVIKNEAKLHDTPILVEAFLNFLDTNQVFGPSEKSTRFGVAQGKKIVQLAKEEMPHANKLANIFPDKWGKACGALWGQRLSGPSTWVFGELLPEETTADSEMDTLDPVAPVQPVITGDDIIFEPTDTELLIDGIEPPSINGVQTEWTNINSNTSGWGSLNAWGSGDTDNGAWHGEGEGEGDANSGENSGENPTWNMDAFKEPPPPDPSTVWGNFAPPGREQLESIIGPNELARNYVTLRVEISSRVIGTLTEPAQNTTAASEGNSFADIAQRRLARLTLSPSRFLKTAPAYGACITQPDVMGLSVDDSRFTWVGSHDPSTSDITIFVPTDEDLLDVIRKGTGMTITGTFIQVAELAPPKEDAPAETGATGGAPPKKKKKKGKTATTDVRSWWFLYQLTQVFPTFYEQ